MKHIRHQYIKYTLSTIVTLKKISYPKKLLATELLQTGYENKKMVQSGYHSKNYAHISFLANH